MTFTISRRAFVGGAASAAFVSTSPGLALSEEAYPSKTVTFIVPYSAGGAPDFMARVVAQHLQKKVGQSIVVDNRPGANGSVAASVIASAPTDGYTFLVAEGSLMSINPHLYKSLSYDPAADFKPVSLVGTAPTFLAVHPDLPVASFREFVEYAKAPPSQLNYGSSGVGSAHHLSMEALIQAYRLKMTHIPYRGSGQSVPALVGGQVSAIFASYSAVSSFAKAGRLKLLATNNKVRTQETPDIPAIAEFVSGFDFASRMGLVARTGTPPDRIDHLSKEIAVAMKDETVISELAKAGIVAVGSDPEAYGAAIQQENTRMAAVIVKAGIKTQD